MRIGNSIDFHPFKENRKLILGGIEIPFNKGLDGVSDADCLIHSIGEAILGALALGDLGKYFKESECKDMDSKIILKEINKMMKERHYHIVNIDSMVLLEEPRLSTYIDKMRECISNILSIDINQISIKATTMEKRGIIGKGEGILSEAVVLIDEDIHD